MQVGDYGGAAQMLQELEGTSLDEGVVQLDLGRVYLEDGQPAEAVDVFGSLLMQELSADLAQEARLLLGDALVEAGEPLAAAEHYRAYIAAGTTITSYVSEWLGDALYAGGDGPGAIEAYQAAVDGAPMTAVEVWMREKLALAYALQGEFPAAVAEYEAILSMARIPHYRARIEYQLAETLLAAGETEAGYARHLAVVERFPTELEAYKTLYWLEPEDLPAYQSLVRLVEAGQPVDDLLRGIVDYYGEAYEASVAALYRHTFAYPETHSGDAHWYAALSYLAMDDFENAMREFQLLLDTHPESDRLGDAWMAMADATYDAGDAETAIALYQQFREALPDDKRAPEALWEIGWIQEWRGEFELAASAYMDCHVRYPSSELGEVALFRSGLQSFRADDLLKAAVAWDTLAAIYPRSEYRAAALLWLGRTRLTQADREAAQEALRRAQMADPTGYYGLRAGDLLESPRIAPFEAADYVDEADLAAEQAEAEAWLAEWTGAGSEEDLGSVGSDLAADPFLQRGLELWRLDRLEEARVELEALRQATIDDPVAQYRLALLFRDIGLYRSSIFCAVQVVHLSPVTDMRDAPRWLARLAYPTYYEDLVLENAERFGLDPLLIFAVLRQESLFESIATSAATAQGLMQVIPPTGAEIAAELSWPPDYETGDLYKPYVSVRFGSYYLAKQRDRFDGRPDVALAGYNGGPFNAERWLEAAGDDPDLFIEMITFSETRLYVRRVKEHFEIYQSLYAR
jgi:soluble lytic murein transglycosylase